MRSAKKCLTTILTALALAGGAMAADAPKSGAAAKTIKIVAVK